MACQASLYARLWRAPGGFRVHGGPANHLHTAAAAAAAAPPQPLALLQNGSVLSTIRNGGGAAAKPKRGQHCSPYHIDRLKHGNHRPHHTSAVSAKRAMPTAAPLANHQHTHGACQSIGIQIRRAAGSAGHDASQIEEQYQRKTAVEHVLLRPGMYIGAIEPQEGAMWVYNKTTHRMVQKDLQWSAAMCKLFDEILVNAADNTVRVGSGTTQIDVELDRGSIANSKPPSITVRNNGKGVPVVKHSKENMYVPEMVFGHLLTGSNFSDDDGQLTGGRHGYGAKLTNIFSTSFTIETADCQAGLGFKQTWHDNMSRTSGQEVWELEPGTTDYTQVSFTPDLHKLGIDGPLLPKSDLDMLTRRVVDVAGTVSPVDVTLNGKPVPVSNFRDFVNLFAADRTGTKRRKSKAAAAAAGGGGALAQDELVFAEVNPRWQVGVRCSAGRFTQVSFVNNMATHRGGTHVTYVNNQIVKHIQQHINKKWPDLEVTTNAVRPHVALFIKAQIANPGFDAQVKDFLTSKPDSFGSTCALPPAFLKQVVEKTGIVEKVVAAADKRQRADLRKQTKGAPSKQNINVPKLEDAVYAGGSRSDQCTLILTEGDSAKALAVAGLEVVGREEYGIFPLRGKLLNVRDATMKQLRENAELGALCAILGLDFNNTYAGGAGNSKLRYGKVLIMADQDHDGSHIKGLIINLFAHFWPNLLSGGGGDGGGGSASDLANSTERPFVGQFVTPIIKAKRRAETISFSTVGDYLEWRNRMTDGQLRQWSIKYYKGLGTSTAEEAREYFKAFDEHVKWFEPANTTDSDAIDKVFNRARAADRRDWLLHHDTIDDIANAAAIGSGKDVKVGLEDFVDQELVHFSRADNVRSIPNVIDGLKPSQRKVLHSCFKRNLTDEVKVAQLAGYISEHTAYHHGEASLHATIVNMSQDFIGSNNVPLLAASGQFGTRHHGGKDAASPRYIHTYLTPAARKIFREEDDCLLDYLEDDGQVVEPNVFAPIIPMLLVNGSQGIGTGWSTSIPKFNPLDLIDCIRSVLQGGGSSSSGRLKPWIRGFAGSIVQTGDLRFTTSGIAESKTARKFEITELPVGKWTHDYKTVLSRLMDAGRIQSFTEHHSNDKVHFKINMPLRCTMPTDKQLGLESALGLTNMHAFDSSGTIRKYDSAEQILEEFMSMRADMYVQRKAALEAQQEAKLIVLQNKARFVHEIATGKIDLLQVPQPKAASVALLHERGYAPDAGSSGGNGAGGVSSASYDYLLNMPIYSFTEERLSKLHLELSVGEKQLARLLRATAEQMWRSDLDDLEGVLLQDPLYAQNRSWHA